MSEVEEHKPEDNEVLLKLAEVIDVVVTINEVKPNIVEEKEEVKEVDEEKKEDVLVKTFLQLFELLLTQDQSNLEKCSVKLAPEIQQYFLLLCKETPDLFGTFEETFKKIILDNRIDTKDIPDILLLVSKVYNITKENKGCPMVDPYDVIKSLLHLALVLYLETNKVENPQLLIDLLKIVETSIDLIKMKPIKPKKVGCLFGVFNC